MTNLDGAEETTDCVEETDVEEGREVAVDEAIWSGRVSEDGGATGATEDILGPELAEDREDAEDVPDDGNSVVMEE